MEVSLLLVADYANTTGDEKLNVMGVFTNIFATNFPAVHPQMYLVAQLKAGRAEYGRKFDLGIKLINEDGKEILSLSPKVEVPTPQGVRRVTLNFVLSMVNIPFEKPGIYEFSLLVDNDVKQTLPIEASLAQPAK